MGKGQARIQTPKGWVGGNYAGSPIKRESEINNQWILDGVGAKRERLISQVIRKREGNTCFGSKRGAMYAKS